MPIVWEDIEGYNENLSAEEKLALLDKYELAPITPPAPPVPTDPPEGDTDGNKPVVNKPKEGDKVISKAHYDKVASELAKANKKLREKMTEDEIREAERQQKQEEMELELERLRKEKAISEYKSSLLALGCDDQIATNSATALAEGEINTVFSDMKKHMAAYEKSVRAQILKETPTPPAGDNPDNDTAKTAEEIIHQQLYGKRG